jgi:peptidoglycan/LPS O-acetylase OafA/YrhL
MDAANQDAPFHLGYRRWLDGLRGWAVLLVLGYHLGLVPGGGRGVDIFFVLSGFLITTLLAEEWQRRGAISFRHFYLRRALRLVPGLFVLLATYGLYCWVWLPRPEAIARSWEILVAGCYIANWPSLHGIHMPSVMHTWTLSLEEQFYLVWPALLYLLLALGLSRRRILMLVCAGIVASVALRITLYHLHRAPGPDKLANFWRMYMGLDTRADALLVGCLTGLAATWNLLPRSRRFVRGIGMGALVSAAAIAFLVVFDRATMTVYFHGLLTVFALMVAVIIVRLLVAPSRLGTLLLESAPLVGIGRISYGLYLYHALVMYWLEPAEYGWNHPTMTATALGLSLAAALVSFYCIERPFLRLKDRLGHRTDAPTPAASGPSIDGVRLPPPGVAA